ncbi:hypothetical protein COY87_02330 [Candidatus Roizmanbacteria bacterium CG_4_10_14_0_8_um_filter_33_9]|uniref:Fimbrial assembly protein n=1 Tax=Candidatus Roizmanbacteria bacterium CG_4_10_14_0_8_um_filter_33_9 TaxID=1974826 RepID=A0A2M7QIL9_9BACT|nr:MAG: hypothetical protein COY87_02330 [Candidatus Roizmanbacteria bacterium CG_4_10_14_0_8_um_filter_33_9]
MRYRINLLEKKEKDFTQKVIYFALHYLRYILVLTQIVVIGVFFYRFKIDQEIIDLKDALKQKEEIVLVSQPLLKQAEIIDFSMNQIQDIVNKQSNSEQMLQYFLNTFPKKINTKKVTFNENSISFEASTTDPRIIKQYYDRLKQENVFKSVTLRAIRKVDFEFYCQFNLRNFSISKK